MKLLKLAHVLSLLCVLVTANAEEQQKKWLIVENKPSAEVESDFSDFSRLLLMQISKAGVFRCVDRATYKTQTTEVALGDGGDVEFQSVGYCITWIVRTRKTARGQIITASLGYNNIGKDGNNELIRSEDVVVFERGLNGVDLATKVAEKSARAILFNLMPPQVVDISLSGGKKTATVDYGEGFLFEGEQIYFLRRKKSKRGKTFSRRVGLGVVSSISPDSASISLLKGDVKEDDFVMLKEKENPELAKADLCPRCDGKKRVTKEVKCDACNGQGFTRILRQGIGGRNYWRDKPCSHCRSTGVRGMKIPCPECNGHGNSSIENEDNEGCGYSKSSGFSGR